MNDEKFQALYKNTKKEEIIEELYYKCKANNELVSEIERLKEEIKGYEQERERVLNIIEERNHKAIEYIEENKTSFEDNLYCFDNMLEDVTPLLDILKGVDK